MHFSKPTGRALSRPERRNPGRLPHKAPPRIALHRCKPALVDGLRSGDCERGVRSVRGVATHRWSSHAPVGSHAPSRAARMQHGSRSSLIGRQYPPIVPSSASRPPAAARCVHAGAGSRRTFHAMSFGEGIRRRELTRGTARAREAGSAAPAGANAAAGAAAAAQQAAKSAIECMLSRRRPRMQNL